MGSGWVWPPWSARAAPPSLAHAREVQQLVQPVTCGYRLPSLARAREVQLPMLHAPPPIPCQIAPRHARIAAGRLSGVKSTRG